MITTGVDLKALKIEVLNARASITLAVRKEEEAAILAEKLRAVVGVDGRVNRPTTTASVLLLDVPPWIAGKDVQESLVAVGAVSEGETPPPVILRPTLGVRSGNVVASFVLPAADAVKIGEAGRIQVGWSRCRV